MSQYRFSIGTEQSLTSRARGLIGRMGLLLLGAAFATGCGGVAAEDETAAQPSSSIENASPASEDQGNVSDEAACCYAKCSNNGWYGPYINVDAGNCHNFGVYLCNQKGMQLSDIRWGSC